jgi:hypothetical protein
MLHEQRSRRHKQFKRVAIENNHYPQQTPEAPPRPQIVYSDEDEDEHNAGAENETPEAPPRSQIVYSDEDEDEHNAGTENETWGLFGKKSKTLKKPMLEYRFRSNIIEILNDEPTSMSGKNNAKDAAALDSTGGNTAMFMSYTISEDRTGSQESVTMQRLSVLRARYRKRKMQEFSHSLVREETDPMKGILSGKSGRQKIPPFEQSDSERSFTLPNVAKYLDLQAHNMAASADEMPDPYFTQGYAHGDIGGVTSAVADYIRRLDSRAR